MLPTIGPYLLPRVAREIRKALPRLDLRLYEYTTAAMLAKLRAGEIDLGILALAGRSGWARGARALR